MKYTIIIFMILILTFVVGYSLQRAYDKGWEDGVEEVFSNLENHRNEFKYIDTFIK